MKKEINTFYVLNLLSIIDGEILESAHVDVSKYVGLDISTEKGQKAIINELLKPEMFNFSIENYDEIKLENILNFYSGSVFLMSSNSITYKEILEIFYTGVFFKNINNEELNNFIFFENDDPKCWNLFYKQQ